MSANKLNSRLYLEISASAFEQFSAMNALLEQLTNALDIACVSFPRREQQKGEGYEGDERENDLITRLQQKNIAVLADLTSADFSKNRKSFEKALEQAAIMKFDGLHMRADAALYDRAREVLGANSIIGVDCQNSKHLAMQLGERGADYVAIGALDALVEMPEDMRPNETQLEEAPLEEADGAEAPMDLVSFASWWQELFEVPFVASNVRDQAQIEALMEIPADFIAIGPALWSALSSDAELLSWLSVKFPALKKGS